MIRLPSASGLSRSSSSTSGMHVVEAASATRRLRRSGPPSRVWRKLAGTRSPACSPRSRKSCRAASCGRTSPPSIRCGRLGGPVAAFGLALYCVPPPPDRRGLSRHRRRLAPRRGDHRDPRGTGRLRSRARRLWTSPSVTPPRSSPRCARGLPARPRRTRGRLIMAQSRQIPLFDLGPDPVHSADAQGSRQARCRAPVGHARFKNDWRTPSARITAQGRRHSPPPRLRRTD